MPERSFAAGQSEVVWGITSLPNGTAFTIDYGDGSTSTGPDCGAGDTVLDRSYIACPHTYALAGPYTVTRLDGISHLSVGRATLLRFKVDATLEPYLGALAHMSAFEVRTQSLTHLHPAATELTFHTQFANRGEYRLFMDFQVAGALHRAAFTVFVT